MFGKKKKHAQVEEQQVVVTETESEQVNSVLPMQEADNGKIYFESEIIEDDEYDDFPVEYVAEAYNIKQDAGEDLLAQPVDDEPVLTDEEEESVEPTPVAPVLEEATPALEEAEPMLEEADGEEDVLEEVDEDFTLEEVEDDSDDTQNVELTPADTQANNEEEVVYVVDGPSEDDDEIVKPAKLVKLPNLVDYMLSQNMSKKMKMNVATLLLSAYKKYKDIPEEKKIVIQCMAKVMRSLIQG